MLLRYIVEHSGGESYMISRNSDGWTGDGWTAVCEYWAAGTQEPGTRHNSLVKFAQCIIFTFCTGDTLLKWPKTVMRQDVW